MDLLYRVQRQLQNVFRDFNATCIDLRIGNNCMKMTGYIAIYKVSFSITLFFVIMFFITIGVTTSKGIRACIHNGFWLLKVSFFSQKWRQLPRAFFYFRTLLLFMFGESAHFLSQTATFSPFGIALLKVNFICPNFARYKGKVEIVKTVTAHHKFAYFNALCIECATQNFPF